MARVNSSNEVPKMDVRFFAQRNALFTQANHMFTSLGAQVHVSLLHQGQRYEYTSKEESRDLKSKTGERSVSRIWTPKDFGVPTSASRVPKNKTTAEIAQEAEIIQVAQQVRGLPTKLPDHNQDSTRRHSPNALSTAEDTIDLTAPNQSSVKTTTPPPPPREPSRQSTPRQRWPDLDSPTPGTERRDPFGPSLSARSPDESGVLRRTSLGRVHRYKPY